MEVRGKNILITGANRGIGRALARIFAEDAAHLHLAIRKDDPELVAELKKHGAASVKVWESDLGSREGVDKLIYSLSHQEIDILINNAGQMTGGLIEDQPLDDIYSMFQVNLLAVVQLTRGLLPQMVKRGSGMIVNNASVMAYMWVPCASTYCAAKSAVAAFSECVRAEVEGTGVKMLTLVTPGVRTRMHAAIPEKYGDHLDYSSKGMQPSEYAKMVREAVLLDLPVLEPKGFTGIGLKVAQYVPSVFRWRVQKIFHREKQN